MFDPNKQDNDFNKRLYESKVFNDLLDRIAELEDHIKKLESEKLK